MAGIPAGLDMSLDDVIAARKADRGRDRVRAPDTADPTGAKPRRRRRGGRGRSGAPREGPGGPRGGGVDKLAAKRADVTMGDAAPTRKPRRRSGKPRAGRRAPLLPAHAVEADGSVSILFDGATVARVAVDGTVTLDTTPLADRDAARGAPLRRALAAALEVVGVKVVAVGEGSQEWQVTASGGETAPFVDGMTVAAGAGAAATVKAHLEAGRVAKKAAAVA